MQRAPRPVSAPRRPAPACACCACSPRIASTSASSPAILGVAQSGVSRHLGLLRTPASSPRSARRVRLLPAAGRRARPTPRRRSGRCSTRSSPRRATTGRCARTRRGCRKCCGIARKTSTPHGDARQLVPAAAGRRGRARSATCCRRSTSPTSAAARAT